MRNFTFINLFILYCLVTNPVLAQDPVFPPAKSIIRKDTANHKADSVFHVVLNTTGSLNKSEGVTSTLFNNMLNLGMKKKTVSFNFDNNYVYGKSGTALTNEDFSSVFQVNFYKPKTHFYYWGLANYNTSYSLKVNYQVLAGGGAAYSIFDTKHSYLNISDGLLSDNSDLVLPDTARLVYHTIRNSFRLQFKFNIKDKVIFDGSDFLQNSLQEGSDYIIRSTTNLSVKITNWLNLSSSLNYDIFKRTQSSSLIFTYGLKFDRYF
jgi:hypothetical protein